MTDRPYLFSGRMVRELLAGRKTQTRRLVTARTSTIGSLPISAWSSLSFVEPVPDLADPTRLNRTHVDNGGAGNFFCARDREQYLHVPHVDGDTVHRVYCRTQVGDRLWVKETFFVNHLDHVRGKLPAARPLDGDRPCELLYRADGDFGAQLEQVDSEHDAIWRPGIFMKRWASRITRIVEEVRVQRLHDITPADALAEGIIVDVAEACPCHGDDEDPGPHIESCPWQFEGYAPSGSLDPELPTDPVWETPPEICVFAALWDSINGARPGGAWNDNPWVWAITMRSEEA